MDQLSTKSPCVWRTFRNAWVGSVVAAWACVSAGAAAPKAGGEFQGVWTHAGPRSAVVCWRMKDLADEAASYVEYGPTGSYGRKTPPTTEPRWAHFHRLSGLRPGSKVTAAKVHRNYVRIRQPLPEGDVKYVPATPLNVACYDPAAMNEICENDIVALTDYRTERIGGYGRSGQWASAIHFVGMTHGAAPAGKYSAYIHDNRFVTNHLFASSSRPVTQTVRIEKNTFTLAKAPPPVPTKSRFRRIGPLEQAIKAGGNTFR